MLGVIVCADIATRFKKKKRVSVWQTRSTDTNFLLISFSLSVLSLFRLREEKSCRSFGTFIRFRYHSYFCPSYCFVDVRWIIRSAANIYVEILSLGLIGLSLSRIWFRFSS